MTRKGRQGAQAASGQIGCLAAWPCNLQQCELGSLTAWMLKQLQLGCWTAWLLSTWLYDKCSLEAWQRGFTTVCCLAAWKGEYLQSRKPKNMQPSLDQTPTRPYIISFQRSGSKVWINSLGKVWIGGLDQRSGSFVGPGLDPDFTFWAAAISAYRHWDVEFTPLLPRHISMIGPPTAALSSLLPSTIFCKYARIFSCKMRPYPLTRCNLKNITKFTIPSCSKSIVPGCLLSRINLCIIASVMRPLHGMGLGNDPTWQHLTVTSGGDVWHHWGVALGIQ